MTIEQAKAILKTFSAGLTNESTFEKYTAPYFQQIKKMSASNLAILAADMGLVGSPRPCDYGTGKSAWVRFVLHYAHLA